MATANPSHGAFAVEEPNGADPFVTGSHDAHRQRYAAFDNSSLYVSGSPAQAERALQAHLAETTRRLQETSHLGNALVQQRKELEDRLREVAEQKQANDIGPELREKLIELEKEFNEVGRETARAFLPKSRVPSGEANTATGASEFISEGHQSPTKISIPSRKQRNQQPSRINDIALATEISTSLLAQLKDLQAVLLEKDEALKAANLDRSQLEIEVEGLSQRMRTLDESESRLKDVNWNLETQLRDFETQTKAATDREQRLNHTLNLARSEKATLEREFEELKQMYSKINDDHLLKVKQHETELSGLRRNVSMGETERGALQRKMEELATQNHELARAVQHRLRAEEQGSAEDTSPDENPDGGNTITPEHSPPPSPIKPTPRHGQLESETLKHSLHHAHRMIQQLKNNIHREKTEKIELKRMLQDARDELESNRNALPGPGSASKRRKNDKDVFKKPARPDRLGALRHGSQEIVALDDDEWEEHDGVPPTPSRAPRPVESVPGAWGGFSSAAETSANEGFETANETSDAAFETANERDGTTTETDAFQTGAETLDGDSSDDLTETEAGPATGTIRQRPSSLAMAHHDSEMRTPVQPQSSRFRKVRQGSNLRGSPARRSFDDGSAAEGTPTRSTFRRPPMVDSGMMTEPWSPPPVQHTEPQSAVLPSFTMSGLATQGTEPRSAPVPSLELSTYATQDTTPHTVPAPSLGISRMLSLLSEQNTVPRFNAPTPLQVSSVSAQDTTPQSALPPSLYMSNVSSQGTVPQSPSPPSLFMSNVSGHGTVPESPSPPSLNMSSFAVQGTEPTSPVVARAAPAVFVESRSSSGSHEISSREAHVEEKPQVPIGLSSLSSQHSIPTEAPQLPPLSLSGLFSQGTVPVESPRPAPSQLSTVAAQTTAPQDVPPTVPMASRPPPSSISSLFQQHTEPAAPERMPSQFSSVSHQVTEPSAAAASALSQHWSLATEPVQLPQPSPPQLSVVTHQTTAPYEPERRLWDVGAIATQHTEPVNAREVVLPEHQFSDVTILHNTQPESPTLPEFLPSPSRPSTANRVPPTISFSTIVANETEPEIPSRPQTAHRAIPIPIITSSSGAQTEIAQEQRPISKDGRVPLGQISSNVPRERSLEDGYPFPKQSLGATSDEGTQTMVSAEQIDRLLLARSQRYSGTIAGAGVEKAVSPPASPSRRNSNEVGRAPRRPGSSSSMRSRTGTPPPLPADHKQVIAAAALKSPPPLLTPTTPNATGTMGPPIMPASAYKNRPSTPSIRTKAIATSPRAGATTPRPRHNSQTRSGATSPVTRRSSMSSFSSEIDHRFNIPAGMTFSQTGLDPSMTDPRMIQAITQTMCGEFLWKYTRKAGRETMSETRHRRFFWVHPYTRTLYWSEHDPQTAGRAQLKAKSVAISEVHEVSDDNPLPPGLHIKSLVVVSPGRTIKFTATTSQRHETWFNALLYLLKRTEDGDEGQPSEPNEIQSEFNGGYRSSSRQTGRSRASHATYNSRRTSSPYHAEVPTLRQSHVTNQRSASTEPGQQSSVGARFSTMLRSSSAMRGSFSSRFSKASVQEAVPYEEPSNSAADLSRELVESNQRAADRLVDVRACCDGKHHVGQLHAHSFKGRHGSFHSRPSFIGSVSSRSQSRTESRNESRNQTELERQHSSTG
ncbi:uncharacterized protein CC84DRAFT_1187566 [Paraphaeosphaeria sporulosa]|uniref:PH domain-containing protein n=1 Tax=Paraphaeosphaeria sporulosa TaxID=1460663 RepID=A0A177CCI9_9PLEO|nr:uncharacterized protein CC84DRAFT_1187566 [Paraphaeosphaeria sporulosa]OAG04519.1 hypothetical protein CC84DRAFT_1187566 [Paraphaeosphaeria sporulosa]